jgi:multisubunit Na+/H+ antiporter MnhC subunit
MGLVLTVTAGLLVWIVLWSISSKGLDAFLLALAIILVGATLRILSGYLPGRRS